MGNNHKNELPIRSKIMMQKDVAKAIYHLHRGEREKTDIALDDLKARAIYLDEKVQQDVLMFAEQIHFQYDYDPWHKVTREVGAAADRLLSDL